MARKTRGAKAGAAIRRLRDERGFSVEELAETAGVSARQLYRIEGGEIAGPRLDLLEKIARALGVELSELTG